MYELGRMEVVSMRVYPTFVTPDFVPFDPVELATETERIVCRGNKRKYTRFYATGVYGGIATGYTVGCCLRCVFCWVGLGREFPRKYGSFYSPEEAFQRLRKVAERYGTRKARVSGAEPTIGREHLVELLKLVEDSEFEIFVLETNGMLFGVDRGYAEEVSKLRKVHIRVSLKAGTAEDFTRKTGGRPEVFELPFRGIRNLLECGASFHVAAMSLDPRITTPEEREALLAKLWLIDPRLVRSLEEEVVDPYRTTLIRLKKAGMELEWPLRGAYGPAKSV